MVRIMPFIATLRALKRRSHAWRHMVVLRAWGSRTVPSVGLGSLASVLMDASCDSKAKKLAHVLHRLR